ncbi:hypothetical protein SLS53_004021 [Cytospora paraplurivora]|uniref:Uncharacterized protein n=1 Tax=Cytospora paraplurivora TaxID=2898453 RepID=A0AAN9UB85_9PEZI
MQLPLLSSHVTNTYAVQHPSTAVAGSSARANSLQGNVERPMGGAKEPVSQQTEHRSNFIEELPEQSSLSGDLWSRSKTPLDTDQLSFTSALTNLDVKRSFHDLGSHNTDFEHFSLDRGAQATTNQPTKVTLKRIQVEVTKSPAYAKKHNLSDYFSMSTTEAAFIPNPPSQAPPPRSSGRGQTLSVSTEADRRSSITSHARADDIPDSSLLPLTAASAYLQEARSAAPTTLRTSAAKPHTAGSSTATSSSSLLAPRAFGLGPPPLIQPAPPPPAPASLTPPSGGPAVPNARHSSLDTTGLKPIAKMFVECCHCRFYQDMPSRVYEAMARPEDTVRDKRLGVSGQVTTCVKCPWCSHNMSTQCCAGYAAVVYLREKLHGV